MTKITSNKNFSSVYRNKNFMKIINFADMFERPTIYVLLYAASILGLQGQSIDSVVQDAVTSAFNRGTGTTRQPTRERSLIPTSEQ